MALKTKLEILEKDHDSAVDQLLENEINLTVLTRRAEKIKPGKEYDEIQTTIDQKKSNIERIKEVLAVIEEMIVEEKK